MGMKSGFVYYKRFERVIEKSENIVLLSIENVIGDSLVIGTVL